MKLFIPIIILVFTLYSCKKASVNPTTVNNSKSTTTIEDTNVVYIKNFDSTSVKINGSIFVNEKATDVTFTIKYIGGNGKSYIGRSFESTGISGLTATLQEGKLAKGDGVFNFVITGIPYETGEAIFTIIFANQKCVVKLKVTEVLIPKLDCTNIKFYGSITAELPTQKAYFTLNYSENKNGVQYIVPKIYSKDVFWLTATPNITKTQSEFGEIRYDLSGTPDISGNARFDISIGNNLCEFRTPVLPSPYKRIKDIENNIYKTITIGTQEWMAENLVVTKYNDGTPIPLVNSDSQWITTKTGAYCENYCILYNGYVATNIDKNVCPVGWHVPTKEDWEKLINYLGDNNSIKLRAVSFNGTNSSLFNALPNGSRGLEINGGKEKLVYFGKGSFGMFWSSTTNNTNAYDIVLFTLDTEVNMQTWSDIKDGESIRCVKD